MTKTIEDGMVVERPDYWVVRVSLLGMNDQTVRRLKGAIEGTRGGDMALHAKASLAKIDERLKATTKGEEYRYVNIAGGPRGGPQIRAAKERLEACGLGSHVNVVPGPLIRATRGRLLQHMPLAVASSYTHAIGALKAAWEISKEMEEPDLELDLEGLEEPKWAHHTFRRTGDRMARASMEETGVTEETIDEVYGWNQAARAKVQQIQYAGRADRSKRARVTMMI